MQQGTKLFVRHDGGLPNDYIIDHPLYLLQPEGTEWFCKIAVRPQRVISIIGSNTGVGGFSPVDGKMSEI